MPINSLLSLGPLRQAMTNELTNYPLVGTKAKTAGQPIYNPDGSSSSERTITVGFGEKGKEKQYLLRTIIEGSDGRLIKISDEEAISLFRMGKNKPVGIFNSVEEANAFAGKRSHSGGRAVDDLRYRKP